MSKKRGPECLGNYTEHGIARHCHEHADHSAYLARYQEHEYSHKHQHEGQESNIKSHGAGTGNEESIRFGIAGAIEHPEVDYDKVNYSKSAWALEPTQMIAYVSCHADITIPDGEYRIICQDGRVNSECLGILSGSTATVAPTSALILAR